MRSVVQFFLFFFFNIILLFLFFSWIGLSYKNLFRQLSEERSSDYYYERGFMYDPNALDDPEMLHGEHRYVQHPAAVTGMTLTSPLSHNCFHINAHY
jgi:hypothetical protein